MTGNKYELTDEKIEFAGRTLHRIKSCIDFKTISGQIVNNGDLGGYIEKYDNLSQTDKSWVFDHAWVYGDASVCGDARVYGDASVCGNAWVHGDASVCGNAKVYGNASVCGNAWVHGDACVYGNAKVYGNVRVFSDAKIAKTTEIFLAGPIGSRNDFTTFYKNKNDGISVKCGCFNGSIDDFENTVKENHNGTKHEKTYLKLIELAKIQIEIGGKKDDVL